VERLLLASPVANGARAAIDLFVATFPETLDRAIEVSRLLRRAGLKVDLDFLGRSMKAQMKEAARLEARVVVVFGPDELERGVVTLRDMAAGSQEEVAEASLVGELKRRMNG
jgi:histidyl-tRNA synthetase